MENTSTSMNTQYGEKKIQMDVSPFLLTLIKKYGISREDYACELIKKYNLHWKLLDIGCGDGSFCAKNIENFDTIHGIDISDSRINKAKEQYSGIDFSVVDMNKKVPFEDNYFDSINSLVTFDWIYDLNLALSETHRILKQDGIFILEVNNMGFLLRRIELLFWKYPKVSAFSKKEWKNIGWDASVCHMFTKDELREYIKEFGFSILEVRWSGFAYRLRDWWPSLLCGDLFFVLKKI